MDAIGGLGYRSVENRSAGYIYSVSLTLTLFLLWPYKAVQYKILLVSLVVGYVGCTIIRVLFHHSLSIQLTQRAHNSTNTAVMYYCCHNLLIMAYLGTETSIVGQTLSL